MTTTVRVDAHCDANRYEVEVTVKDGNDDEVHTIQDGESFERAVYDARAITVREVPK